MGLPAFQHTTDEREEIAADVKELKEKVKNLENEHKR
jgi:polyhydroxyalkanoate synthesis regulator phasin